jgi:hypothetical protein
MRPEAAWKAGQLHAVQVSSSSPEPGELAGLARRVHHALARTTRTAWLLATGEDLRYPATEGARLNVQTRILHRYLSRLLRVLGGNRTVNAAFLDVANLVQPSATLSHPRYRRAPAAIGRCPGQKWWRGRDLNPRPLGYEAAGHRLPRPPGLIGSPSSRNDGSGGWRRVSPRSPSCEGSRDQGRDQAATGQPSTAHSGDQGTVTR